MSSIIHTHKLPLEPDEMPLEPRILTLILALLPPSSGAVLCFECPLFPLSFSLWILSVNPPHVLCCLLSLNYYLPYVVLHINCLSTRASSFTGPGEVLAGKPSSLQNHWREPVLGLTLELLTQGLQTSWLVPCYQVKITQIGWKMYIISWEWVRNLQQGAEGDPKECEPRRVPEGFPIQTFSGTSIPAWDLWETESLPYRIRSSRWEFLCQGGSSGHA